MANDNLLREDHHVHSTFSDGQGTLEENIAQAEQLGLAHLGCVDHVRADTTYHPDYAAAVRALRPTTAVTLSIGIEAKILDTAGHLDLPATGLELIDVIYVADHQFPSANGPRSPREVKADLANGGSAEGCIHTLVDATVAAMRRHRGHRLVLAHVFSILPKIGLAEDQVSDALAAELVAAAADTGTVIEISERWRCPSVRVISAARAAGVRIICSTDGHRPSAIGRYDYVRTTLQADPGMTIGAAMKIGGASADAQNDANWAARRRRRLMVVLSSAAVALVTAAVIAVLLPAAPRERYLSALLVSLVYLGAVPVIASLMQFIVIGFNRFHIGYERLRPCYPRVAIIVPAWNEAEVIGATIERLLAMEYPPANVRVYVVDDASTDETPDVVRAWEVREPERVRHLRRERGGQGKAHTLNHGITQVLAEPWAEAVMIIDADVLFENSALRRMTRHLSNPEIGAVMGYIKEGSNEGNYLTRYIAYEYVTAQAAARRAQNVFGVMACLAGGAQLHSRESLIAIGGRIDTTTLAEDTVTTFRTQLAGKRVVFEPNAVVWAEEPGALNALWKQRLRWARGNVQISLQFSNIWLHGRRFGRLGSGLFALIWFAVLLMPVCMAAASSGLVGLYLLDNPLAWSAFRWLWIFHLITYLLVTTMSFVLDPHTARRAWAQGILFPGLISLGIFIYTAASGPLGLLLTSGLQDVGVPMTPGRIQLLQLFGYLWLTGSMLVAYVALWIERRWQLDLVPKILIQLAGYGSLLGAVTVAAYVREIQGAGLAWDKTVKTGKAAIPQ